MIKLLASDLDGTLLKDNEVSYENQVAIKNLNLSGDLFAISTGRPYNAIEFLHDDYEFDIDYNILLNGSLILDKNKNIILHKFISFDLVLDIINFVNQFNPSISLDTGFKSFNLDGKRTYLVPNNRFIINDMKQISNEKISLISLYFDELSLSDIEDIYNNLIIKYKDKANIFRNSKYIDVVPLECSKGDAIKLLCNFENINNDDIYTIGDSFNDIPMFDITKNSFTFFNAEDDVKKVAKNIVSSVSECINDYILIHSLSEN